MLLDAQSGPRLSPDLTVSSIGPTDSVTNGSYIGFQGRTSISGDQNTVRTVPNDYTEDAAWSVEMDRDDIQNIPPPAADLRNVQDYNAFSWPLLTADTDWQFDFDIPLTAEHTTASTAPSSTALTELDMSPLYSRSTQGFESIGSSGDFIGSLSLNEKVGTLSMFSS